MANVLMGNSGVVHNLLQLNGNCCGSCDAVTQTSTATAAAAAAASASLGNYLRVMGERQTAVAMG